jgi:hypothetical protein
MHLTIFKILAFTFLFSCSLALYLRWLEQNLNVIPDRSVPYENDPVEITKRDETKYVFMHHVSSVQ